MNKIDADWAFAQYERVRAALPEGQFPVRSKLISHISEISELFDVYLLDAFGVLNIGNRVIEGAPEWVAALQRAGKQVLVVANGATFSSKSSLDKYKKFGFEFHKNDIVASRNVLMQALEGRSEALWGVMGIAESSIEELPAQSIMLGNDRADFDRVEGFVFLGSGDWTDEMQAMLVASLNDNPRPVLSGNPDIVAPREGGFTLEPGWYAHELSRHGDVVPELFGKPFQNIYEEALGRVDRGIPKQRIVMVGDTLHTDVLGGAAAGVRTILMADHGLFAGRNVAPYIKTSGIVPDYILTQTSP